MVHKCLGSACWMLTLRLQLVYPAYFMYPSTRLFLTKQDANSVILTSLDRTEKLITFRRQSVFFQIAANRARSKCVYRSAAQ